MSLEGSFVHSFSNADRTNKISKKFIRINYVSIYIANFALQVMAKRIAQLFSDRSDDFVFTALDDAKIHQKLIVTANHGVMNTGSLTYVSKRCGFPDLRITHYNAA